MQKEVLTTMIEAMAEIKSLNVIAVFVLQTMIEQRGGNPEVLARAIDGMNTSLANRFENDMRKAAGLDPRPVPRAITFPSKVDVDGIINAVDWNDFDWDKSKEH